MATHPITRNRHFCGRLLLLLCTIAVLQIVGSAKAGEEKAAPAELIRKSVIAGTWYPASPQDLQKAIRTFMAPIPERETGKELIALISPHAGYAYSGQVAAYGYNLLKHKKFETVVVIAPSHHAVFEGVSVYDRGGYQTPLGIVPLDRDIIELLIQKQSRIRYVPEAHSREHSLEIQLPFLQTVMPGLKLVPLVMGDQSYATCQWLADALAQCIRGRSTLIVASSDLSHFHSYEEARRLDQAVIDNVRKFNPQNLSFDLARGRCEACGGGPMITALLAARQLGADQAEILNYNNSGVVTGARSRVVGYLAAALW
jgi:AmmeMemoRadiSam system protein B